VDTPGTTIDPRLRREAMIAGACTLSGALAFGVLTTMWVATSPSFPLKAAVIPIVLGVLLWPHLAEHAQPTLGPANAVTLLRAVVAGVLAAFLGERVAVDVPWLLVGLASLWFMMDWVDGRVARATGHASAFGARLDMELDALTLMALSALAWQLDRAGGWVLLSGAMRYLYVAATWAIPFMNRPLFPTMRRAWVCGIQVTCLIAALAPWPVPYLSDTIALFGLAALIVSFGIDTVWLVQNRST
jgi:phosphatidylglycerophosphate synthase